MLDVQLMQSICIVRIMDSVTGIKHSNWLPILWSFIILCHVFFLNFRHLKSLCVSYWKKRMHPQDIYLRIYIYVFIVHICMIHIIYIIGNNAFSDRNFHYAHLNSKNCRVKKSGNFWKFCLENLEKSGKNIPVKFGQPWYCNFRAINMVVQTWQVCFSLTFPGFPDKIFKNSLTFSHDNFGFWGVCDRWFSQGQRWGKIHGL